MLRGAVPVENAGDKRRGARHSVSRLPSSRWESPTGDVWPLLPEGAWTRIQQSLNLSPREAEILLEILQDQKETTIAEQLAISPHTVHAHVERLYRKLGVSSRTRLVVRVFAEYLALSEGTSRR